MPGETEVRYGRTTRNSYRFEWVNAHPNRDASTTANASIELFRNGDFETTEGGITTRHSYEIPFPHDGFGQDDIWVCANFTNGAEIVAVGYADWVDDQIGVNLTNGLYKFTASFLSDPPEPTWLQVGDYSVAVTNAGDYAFVLEKGRSYDFGTWPHMEDVAYGVQDDLDGQRALLMSALLPDDTQGRWTVDGGWHWLYLPCDVVTNGWMVLECSTGADRISLWGDATNNTSFVCSNRVESTTQTNVVFFVRGEKRSVAQDDVQWRLSFIPDSGTTNSVSSTSTVFGYYVQPIMEVPVSGQPRYYNPAYVAAGLNGRYRVDVMPPVPSC